MNTQQWQKLRKQLPSRWTKPVLEELAKKGISTNRHTLNNILRRDNTDKNLTIKFWQAVHIVRKKHQKQLLIIKQLKSGK